MTITNSTVWCLKAYPSNKSRHNTLESRSPQSWKRNIPIRLKCTSHLVISSNQSCQWLRISRAANPTKRDRDRDHSRRKSLTTTFLPPLRSDNSNVNTIDTWPNLKQQLSHKQQQSHRTISTQYRRWTTHSRLTSQDQSHSPWRYLWELEILHLTSARKGKRNQ